MRLIGNLLFVLGVVMTLASACPFFIALGVDGGRIPTLIFVLYGLAGLAGLALTWLGLTVSDPLS